MIITLGIIMLLAVLIPQHQAQAVCPIDIADCLTGFTTSIRQFFLEGISWAAGLLNSTITWQTQNAVFGISVVDQSWTIIRNFVNLLFILVLIVLAFGTIFDSSKYSVRNGNVLTSFIIAALLVNFSLAIGQYIITLANGLSNVFLNQMQNLTAVFAQGSSAVSLAANVPEGNILNLTGQVLVTAIFSIIFIVGIFLAFLAAAIFSIVRIFVLWFLLILSPIAWFGYILPNYREKTWSVWWNTFLCWCFWLPYFLFFTMFAAIFVANKDSVPELAGGSIAGLTGNDIIFYGLSLAFLFGGIIQAKKWACATGGLAIASFGNIEARVKKLPGLLPGASYLRAAKTGAQQAYQEKTKDIQERGLFGTGGQQAERLRAARVAQALGAKGAFDKAQSDQANKELDAMRKLNMTLEQLNKKLDSGKGPEKVAALRLKAENGWLAPSDVNVINKALEDAGGGKTQVGSSLIQSLKKGRFHEMAKSTEEKQRVQATLKDVDARKAFLADMAESREIMDRDLSKTLLELYASDAPEVRQKIEEQVKNNIENYAKDKNAREDLINTVTDDKNLQKLQKLAAQLMVEKKEVVSWKTRRRILDLAGGMDANGVPLTVDGRKLAKDMDDGSVVIKEEVAFRKARPEISPLADLDVPDRIELEQQILSNINNKLITNFSTEDLKTPEIFSVLAQGRASGNINDAQLNKLLGIAAMTGKKGERKPDRKRREVVAKIKAALDSGEPAPTF